MNFPKKRYYKPKIKEFKTDFHYQEMIGLNWKDIRFDFRLHSFAILEAKIRARLVRVRKLDRELLESIGFVFSRSFVQAVSNKEYLIYVHRTRNLKLHTNYDHSVWSLSRDGRFGVSYYFDDMRLRNLNDMVDTINRFIKTKKIKIKNG